MGNESETSGPRKIFSESDMEDYMKKIEAMGTKFRGLFMRAYFNIDGYEQELKKESHGSNSELVISSIRANVYQGNPLDPLIEEHLNDCRKCQRLRRYHKIRKGLYEKLGI